MTRKPIFPAAIALVLIAAPAIAGNKLIPAGEPVAVAKSPLTIVPDREWNKMGARPGRNSETWTLDGDGLNDMTFYGGIENDATLFREIDKRGRPLPHFSSNMLLTDLPTLFENSYSIALNTQLMKIDSVEPTIFLGQKGIRFTYSFSRVDEEVRRRGEGAAVVIGGKLYMITFEAPDVFYYQRDLPAFHAIIARASLGAGKPAS